MHPNSWWWIKTDGVDVLPGLGESVRMLWSGDVDLNDGNLQVQYDAYKEELRRIKQLGIESKEQILRDLVVIRDNLIQYLE